MFLVILGYYEVLNTAINSTNDSQSYIFFGSYKIL